MKEADYYKVIDSDRKRVQCLLCPHYCIIDHGNIGKCRVRKNINGKLYALNYGIASSIAVDPIEKKPLYNFFPGKQILSIGGWGCNFKCGFCQNWSISQSSVQEIHSLEISPKKLLGLAEQEKNIIGISYTYNEPLINIEFITETAENFKINNFKNVLVTNGYINQNPLLEILPFIDAANIDLKSFDDEFYKKICGANKKYVLNTIELMFKKGVHVEITNLVIPSFNDSKQNIEKLVEYVASLSKDIPVHFSRYFPQYKFNVPPIQKDRLIDIYSFARKKLNYVYLGNVLDEEYNSTFCPQCSKKIISRVGYSVNILGLKENKCIYCGTKLAIVT